MKPVNYLGRYLVYPNGKIYSIWYKRFVKEILTTNGYCKFDICINNKKTTSLVHRIVAECWIENVDNKLEVNHINGIKSDNRIENLEWCTRTENNRHAWKTGLSKSSEKQRLSASKLVLNTQTGIFYNSAKEASKTIGMKYSTFKNKLNNYHPNDTNFIYA